MTGSRRPQGRCSRAASGSVWRPAFVVLVVTACGAAEAGLGAWSPRQHRLVAHIAEALLEPPARGAVQRLLDGATLADVAAWADDVVRADSRTASWHFVNLPLDASGYDRDRDCPVPGGEPGDISRRWRDCVVDRIEEAETTLADATARPPAHAAALRFLVHLIGDVHQPFHAVGERRGGTAVPVVVFGSPTCAYEDGVSYPCHLHGVWDTLLLGRERIDEREQAARLLQRARERGWMARPEGTPAAWAIEAHDIARTVLSRPERPIDEAYVREHLETVERQATLAGIRLAAALNRLLPPAGVP